jgi:hypothetical protein
MPAATEYASPYRVQSPSCTPVEANAADSKLCLRHEEDLILRALSAVNCSKLTCGAVFLKAANTLGEPLRLVGTIPYPGGKVRLAQTIVSFLPKSGRTYREPFVGTRSHKTNGFPCVVATNRIGAPDAGAGVAAHTSRRPSSDCDEGEVCPRI